jgi:hypothetical protein
MQVPQKFIFDIYNNPVFQKSILHVGSDIVINFMHRENMHMRGYSDLSATMETFEDSVASIIIHIKVRRPKGRALSREVMAAEPVIMQFLWMVYNKAPPNKLLEMAAIINNYILNIDFKGIEGVQEEMIHIKSRMFGKKIVPTITKALKVQAKKHKVRLTLKRGNKRVYKTENVIRKQIENKKN